MKRKNKKRKDRIPHQQERLAPESKGERPVEAAPKPAEALGKIPDQAKDSGLENITPGRLAEDFVTQMEALKQTLVISEVATRLAENQSRINFEIFARSIGAEESQVDGIQSFNVPNEHRRAADQIFRRFDTVQRGKGTLASTFLIALVAEFDVFLSQILRWLWREIPSIFALEAKTVTMRELRDMMSLAEAESVLVEREIDDLLRSSRLDQYAWLEKRLVVKLGTSGERWKDFIEAHERRHLCVHTGCRVSNQYIAACEKLGISDLPQVGERVVVDKKYVDFVASTFSEIAVKTAQVLWRKIKGDPNEAADASLSNVTYRLLEDGKVRLAAVLLEFGREVRKPSSERYRKMWVVNLAQAYKRMGESGRCDDLLKSEDWSAASVDFRIGVAVLNGEAESAARLMREIGCDGPISREDYLYWPLFREFRDSKEFSSTFEEIFGEKYLGEKIGGAGFRFTVSDFGSQAKLAELSKAVG